MTASAWVRTIRAGMAKNWRLSVTYPTWLANRILNPIVWVVIGIFSYTALVPESTVREAFVREGQSPDFVGFLILGQTVYSFFSTLNFRGGMAIQRERWQGTLEAVMIAPTSRVAFILGESLFGLLDGGWTVLLALLVTSVAFGADFSLAHPGLGALAVVLTLSAMVALSVFFAAFYVLTRSAGPLSNAIQSPVRFFSGANFPLSVLPAAAQAVGYALPMTYGMIAVRGAFLGSASPEALWRDLAILAAFTVGFWIAGVLLVHRMERLARVRGTLHRY